MAFNASADGFIIQYGDYQIKFRTVLGWNRRVVLAGPDYIYTKHHLHVRGVLHSDVAWIVNGQRVDPFKQLDQAQAGSITDSMLKPRQKLSILRPDGKVWKEAQVDATFGPNPIDFRLVKIIGKKTFLVEFVIEFTVNEVNGKNLPVLLSNRWVMTHSMDRHFRQFIAVAGRAVFRGDVLKKRKLEPDDFRHWLLFPVQDGWRRTLQSVTQGQAGYEVEYSFVDEQTSVDLYPSWLSDLAISQTVSGFAPSREAMLMSGMSLALTVAGAVATGGASLAASSLAGNAGGQEFGSAVNTLSGGVGAVAGMLPSYKTTIIVTAKGTPLASMLDLGNVCQAAIQYRAKFFNLSSPSVGWQWSLDWMNRQVSMMNVMESAPITQRLDIGGDIPVENNFFSSPLAITGQANQGDYKITDELHEVSKYAPGDRARGEGNSLIRLVAAGLIPDDKQPQSGTEQWLNTMANRGITLDPTTGKPWKGPTITTPNRTFRPSIGR